MGRVELVIGGVPYIGWKQVEFSRSFEDVTGELTATLSELPGIPLPFEIGDSLVMLIDSEPVLTGFVQTVEGNTSWGRHDLKITGRDATDDLNKSTIGPKMTFEAPITLKQVAEQTVQRMGLGIGVVDELNPEPYRQGEVVSGALDDHGFTFLESWARKRQAILNTDGKGNLVITQNLDRLAAGVILHDENNPANNVLSAHYKNSDESRSNAHAAAGQKSTGDKKYWESKPKDFSPAQAAPVSTQWGTAFDSAVRPERRIYYRGKKAMAGKTPKETADWHANVQRTRGLTYKVTVQGFHSAGGALWTPGVLVPVFDAHYYLDTPMFLKEVKFTKDYGGGSISELSFGPPDSYKPQAEAGTAGGRTAKLGHGTPKKGKFSPARLGL